MHDEPVTRGYVVGPGEGVPDQGPEVKASGRSTGGSLTLIEPGRVWTIQRAYGITRS